MSDEWVSSKVDLVCRPKRGRERVVGFDGCLAYLRFRGRIEPGKSFLSLKLFKDFMSQPRMVSEAANFSGGLIRVRWHSIAYAYLSGRRSEQDVYGWRLGIRDIGFEAILVWLNGRSFNKSGLSVLWKRRLYRFIESRSGCKLNRYLYFCFDSTHYLKVSGREYYILAYIMFRLVIPKLDLVRGVDFITEWASCRLDNRGLSRNSREFERAERGGV